jgi:hypothetical protein
MSSVTGALCSLISVSKRIFLLDTAPNEDDKRYYMVSGVCLSRTAFLFQCSCLLTIRLVLHTVGTWMNKISLIFRGLQLVASWMAIHPAGHRSHRSNGYDYGVYILLHLEALTRYKYMITIWAIVLRSCYRRKGIPSRSAHSPRSSWMPPRYLWTRRSTLQQYSRDHLQGREHMNDPVFLGGTLRSGAGNIPIMFVAARKQFLANCT